MSADGCSIATAPRCRGAGGGGRGAAARGAPPDGTRWAIAELALVPLAPGEYVVEVSTGGGSRPADTAAAGPRPAPDTRTLVAFRVVE
jgi:hypothetical protein